MKCICVHPVKYSLKVCSPPNSSIKIMVIHGKMHKGIPAPDFLACFIIPFYNSHAHPWKFIRHTICIISLGLKKKCPITLRYRSILKCRNPAHIIATWNLFHFVHINIFIGSFKQNLIIIVELNT